MCIFCSWKKGNGSRNSRELGFMGARRGLLAEELPFLWVGVEVKGTLTPPEWHGWNLKCAHGE